MIVLGSSSFTLAQIVRYSKDLDKAEADESDTR